MWVLFSYTTAFTLYHCIALIFYFIPLHYLIPMHLPYTTAFMLHHRKIWFMVPENFSTPIYKLVPPIKFFRIQHTPGTWDFSHSTHPHSNHFTYKYQNCYIFISNIWFINHTRFKCQLSQYMVYKPYTNCIWYMVYKKQYMVYGL